MDAELAGPAVAVNLSQAQTELGARGFNGILDASRMTFYLNRGIVDFEDFWHWPWLTKTATGSAPLTIADLKFVLKVYDSTGSELFGISDQEDLDYTTTGTPGNWWIDDTSGSPVLAGYPVGSATLSVRYVAASVPLSGASDTPLIPVAYHNTWIDLAVALAYKDRDNFAASAQLRQMAEADLQRIVERYETRNRMNSSHMLIRAGSEDD